jgi:replicative DNA helicase
VNASHILSLKRTREGDKAWENNRAGDIVNIPVTEYLQTNPYFKHLHKGWRTGVEFTSRELLLIDPYFLGMWLGDGSQRHPAITTGDQEVIDWIVEYASRLKLQHRIEDNSEKLNQYPYHYRGARWGLLEKSVGERTGSAWVAAAQACPPCLQDRIPR